MRASDLVILTIGFLGLLSLFGVLRPTSPEQYKKRGEIKGHIKGRVIVTALSFLVAVVPILLGVESVRPVVAVIGLTGVGAGLLSCGIHLSRGRFFIRPSGWSEIDGHQWWKNDDGLELFFGGLGGPIERNWDVSCLEIVNRTSSEVVIEGLSLHANGTQYVPQAVSERKCQGIIVATGTKAHVICSWHFTSTLGEVYRQGAALTLRLRRGGEPREMLIELTPE